MQSVTNFQDYREFMRQWFAENKQRHSLTWRDFARRAGYVSPVFLKLVSEGKSSLRGTGAERVAQAVVHQWITADEYEEIVGEPYPTEGE